MRGGDEEKEERGRGEERGEGEGGVGVGSSSWESPHEAVSAQIGGWLAAPSHRRRFLSSEYSLSR